jgi:hypothetical protein
VVASLTFLTPRAGLLVLLALVPLAAFLAAGRRVRGARRVLRLPEPPARAARWRLAAIVSVPLLIGVAATQPALRSRSSQPVRADAAVFVVLDTSASMSASPAAHAPTRLAQARQIAVAVGAQLPGIPLGVATFTDRVLPDAFPSADPAIFASTVRAVAIDSPPPREVSQVATDFEALGALRSADFFSRTQTHRALLLITDGESTSFDAAALAHALAASPPIHVVVVRVGGGSDRLRTADGRAGGSYRPDPAGARRSVAQLVDATGGRSFTGGSAGVASALRADIGSGPTMHVASEPEIRSLAVYLVVLSLCPLLLILWSSVGVVRVNRSRRLL